MLSVESASASHVVRRIHEVCDAGEGYPPLNEDVCGSVSELGGFRAASFPLGMGWSEVRLLARGG